MELCPLAHTSYGNISTELCAPAPLHRDHTSFGNFGGLLAKVDPFVTNLLRVYVTDYMGWRITK